MNKPRFIFKLLFFLCALSVMNVFAQTDNKNQAEPCYEVVLQIIVASNSPSDKNSLPPNLSNAVKKLKTLYNFSDYRLTTTFLQRTNSYIEYKSLLSDFNQTADKNYPAFSEWSLQGLRNLPNAQGRNVLQFDAFRFGMKIPIVTGVKDESGKTASSVMYDSTGIKMQRFSINENEPTVIGSLTTSKPDELMFLVLTVKAAE
jgi:hypothetical protein